MNSVYIDLTQTQDAREVNQECFLHQNDLEQVLIWVRETIDSFRSDTPQHIHQAITVLGTRGSGKTTFLLTALHHIQDNDPTAHVFPIIDPTMIEEKGHIFLNVISAINEEVHSFLALHAADEDFSHNKRRWEAHLNQLAHGLPSIDGVGGQQMDAGWQDAEFIMEKGLKALQSARNLRDSFQLLVELALDILGKKYFVMAFDDIDIDFQKGWPVLEMLRKYFSSSKIVTFVSGNLQLYTLAVRKHYLDNFGELLVQDRNSANGDSALVTRMLIEMEGQYLLKVLKPERRVHLSTLYEKLEQWKQSRFIAGESSMASPDQGFPFYVRFKGANEINEASLYGLYQRLCYLFGIVNHYQMEAYTSFLLRLPLRTQIQLLAEFTEKVDRLLSARIEEPFLSELFEKGIDTNLIHRIPQLINVEILKFLLKEKSLGELYQLQPVTSDHTINSCLVALSFQFTQKVCVDPYLVFDYFIKVGYVRNLFTVLGYEDSQPTGAPSIEGLCKYAGLFQNKVLRDIVGNMTSYLKGVNPSATTWAGTISLPALAFLAKQSEAEVAGRIDVVLREEIEKRKVLACLPLSLGTFTTRNQTTPIYSLFMLLGSIGEIIRKAQQGDLERGLMELSQVRTYSVPDFQRASISVNASYHIDFDDEVIDPASLLELMDDIEKWIRNYPAKYAIAPHLLGKIATRTFFALNSIENAKQPENLGDLMHLRVMALFNAILIEEAREKLYDFRPFNINNTVLSPNVFIRNLKAAVNVGRANLPLSQWLLSCPLLLCYLKMNRQVIGALADFCQMETDVLRSLSIFHVLQRVPVQISQNTRGQGASTNSNYQYIADRLRENKVPYEWFAPNADPRTKKYFNNQILQKMKELFGTTDWSPQKVARLRNYLRDNGIRW